jgi:hypothetical protein
MRFKRPLFQRRFLPLVALAGLALANAGCLAVAVGAAAAGGVAGYAYYKGGLYRDYAADLEPTWVAVQAALNDLGLPLMHMERSGAGGEIESRTADEYKVNVWVETVAGQPGEGPKTRVGVRVGVFGDQSLSIRFLDQVQSRLSGVGGPVPAGQPANFAPAPPVPPQTAPPPLADGAGK